MLRDRYSADYGRPMRRDSFADADEANIQNVCLPSFVASLSWTRIPGPKVFSSFVLFYN